MSGVALVKGSGMRWWSRFWKDEFGGTAIEYSVVAVIISIAGVGALALIGPSVQQMFVDASGGF